MRVGRLTFLLAVFGVGLVLVAGAPRAVLQSAGPGGVYWADVADLLLTAPFVVGMACLIRHEIRKRKAIESVKYGKRFPEALFILAIFLFIEGHGIHFAANSIGMVMADTGMTSGAAHDLAYYLDETLGHQIMYTGFLLILIYLLLLDVKHPARHKMNRRENIAVLFSALSFGFIAAMALIEGQMAYPGLVILPTVAITMLNEQKKRGKRGPIQPLKSPMQMFILVSFLAATVIMSMYGIFFGGFPQLTEIGIF